MYIKNLFLGNPVLKNIIVEKFNYIVNYSNMIFW